MNTKHTGSVGEELAVQYLQKKKYTIARRNYKAAIGELDIVARDVSGVLVFVEVKTLSTPKEQFGAENRMLPEYHLTAQKLRKLIRLTEFYIAREKPALVNDWRIDLLAIDYDAASHDYALRHFKNISYQ